MLLGCHGFWQAVEVYLIGRLRFQAGVWSVGVVQLGYKTPIKPAFEKCVIAGIHGMDNQYAFEPKRDEAGV